MKAIRTLEFWPQGTRVVTRNEKGQFVDNISLDRLAVDIVKAGKRTYTYR